MNDLIRYRITINWIIFILLFGLTVFGNLPMFIIIYSYFAVVMSIRTLLHRFEKNIKIGLVSTYALLLANQIVFSVIIVFSKGVSGITFYLCKFFAAIIILLPLMLERFVVSTKQTKFYPPSVEEIATISFELMKDNVDTIVSAVQGINKIKDTVTFNNLKATIGDLYRHSSTKYINNGTLTEKYFSLVDKSLDDPYMYILVSNTGSAASEIISLFTHKNFNHASLSFDRDLKTIISYNGGINVYPPGLNPETIEAFHQKEDASILVYRIMATREQKTLIADKVKEINRDGSAYNIIGLATKHSYKPNIMFCSQFVYKMLKLAGLNYFDKKEGEVRPTDFIELDYHKKLEYCYEIKFQ